jgi:ankyrin repeat protein
LDKGAEVTPVTTNGWTALHVASQQGHQEIAVMLLMKGADKTAKDAKGLRPVDRAREKGHAALVPLLEP